MDVRTDTRPRDGRSRPRWRLPGLLAAVLAASTAVVLTVPSWTPAPPPQVATAASATAAGSAATPAPTTSAPAPAGAPVPAGPATVAPAGPAVPGPSLPVVTGADGTPVARPATDALFDGPADDPGDHFCSGSVVESATGDLVVTAAHCVADGDGTPARTGMSGPWLTGPDDSEILAVTGGYQQGGDSPDVSYGADLGPAAQAAYRSAGGTD
ncbi:lipase chaperone [Pseudonocardia sp. HH130629-09]|uniref:lipase chaperone n=1 Tax=Pseudonocardia sp. HH130629-09 TaxID=1641402 RepID=UPI000760CB8F|nr:lipase chaperone [Pseudonocardia sp. HH130629-09]